MSFENSGERRKLLDLFCGAGGSAVGYHRAGFDVVGIDIRPMPRYLFEFHQADAFEYLAEHGHEFDVIHASPICKPFTKLQHIHGRDYQDQITPLREILRELGRPYIIENVPGAPLINPLKLRGSMFGLRVRRERWFEIWPEIWWPPMDGAQPGKTGQRGVYDTGQNGLVTVAGHNFNPAIARQAMGIDWMTGPELSQAIPPAYTEWIGRQLIAMLQSQ